MKPVGRERDKQIAELKGWIVRKHKASNLTTYPDGYYYDMLHKKEGFQRDMLQWSTSWNDAKELWDELPKIKRLFEEQEHDCFVEYLDDSLKYHQVTGKDFPDAVSQAWIKWKELK